MRVLIACEFSGVVRNAFLEAGHIAYSCDLLPCSYLKCPIGRHFIGDVRPYLKHDSWDLIIAHPPCTYLCNSGVRWLHEREGRWQQMEKGCQLFIDCLNANCSKICVENPIMHKYARMYIGVEYSQIIHPWQFGHGEKKPTCLWLKGLPPLVPTNIVCNKVARVHHMGNSIMRPYWRSIFYKGIARAMVQQWGNL